MNPWDAEREVSVSLAERLVRTQFPAVPGEVRHLGWGWDNEVFTVGDAVVFRFPRREAALPLQARELAVLTLLTDLPLPVPSPTHLGRPAEDYPWPFWGGPLIPGVELAHVAADRRGLGASVGGFLQMLHAMSTDVDLPHDPMRRADPAHRGALALTALGQLAERGLTSGPPYPVVVEGLRVGPGTGRVLCHGDLHLRHVLAYPDGTAAGVIDWGDSCFGDPVLDVSFAFGALSGAAREAFFTAYGQIDAASEVRARVLALHLCAMLALSAHDSRNEPLLAESLAGIVRAQS